MKRTQQTVRAALIQCSNPLGPDQPLARVKQAMIDKHIPLIESVAAKGANICCLQEIFYGPYFCAEQNAKWYDYAEEIPDGPTVMLMRGLAKKLNMAMLVPIYERETGGVLYNTTAVIDQTGAFLGRYRKHHIPHLHPGFWEKFYFRPGTGGYPVFDTAFGRIGVYTCYDRHFPEGARELGLKGAELVFNPSATVAGLSEHLWKLEQPAHAVANQYFIAAINRVGVEAPWNIGEFYGQSYFCNPRGQIYAIAHRSRDEVLVADVNFDETEQARREWQFYRARRPETYKLTSEY